jgi:Na+/H+-translocating membrane pyrophosphatase
MGGIVYVGVDNMDKWYITVAFLTGALTSMLCGALGMQVDTLSSYRTTLAAKNSFGAEFKTTFSAGWLCHGFHFSFSLNDRIFNLAKK